MITREKALELAKRAGMDDKKFFDLLNQEEGYTQKMLDEELDNICGGTSDIPDSTGSKPPVNKKC